MQIPTQVNFDGVPVSDALERAAWEHAQRLDKFDERITSCRIVIGAAHHHHRKGRLYSVRIDITTPGGEVVVNREHHEKHAHEDAFVALRDSFDAARRRLEDHARKRRGDVKTHAPPQTGWVLRLVPWDDHGFIRTRDGREIYFHRNSLVSGNFDALLEGDEVTFHEEAGDKGPNATTVRPAQPRQTIGSRSHR